MADKNKILEKINSLKKDLGELEKLIFEEQIEQQIEKTEEVNKIVYPLSYYKKYNSNVLLKREGNYKIPIFLDNKISLFIINKKKYKNEYFCGSENDCFGLTIEFPAKCEENIDFMSYNFWKSIEEDDEINNLKEATVTIGNEDHKYPLKDFIQSIKSIDIEEESIRYLWADSKINSLLDKYRIKT